MTELINFFHTSISPKAIELANQVLQTGWISEGKMVKEFEMALTRRFGLKNPITVNSGTSALHLALILGDIRPGDGTHLRPDVGLCWPRE